MNPSFIAFPLLVAMPIVAIVTSVHRRFPPHLAARFVTTALVLVVTAAVPTTLVLGLAYLGHAPVIGVGFQWCARAFGLHQAVPTWVGVPTVILIVVGVPRTARVLSDHRRLRRHDLRPIRGAQRQKPYAVTLGSGRGGATSEP